MDYSYSTSTSSTGTTLPASFWVSYIVFVLVLSVVSIVATWKVFEKAGKPGWAAIVPFYNMYVLTEISGYNGWLFLLMLVPFANIVMLVLIALGLAKNFGKSTLFAILGLIFFQIIGMLMLGFGSAKYSNAEAAAVPPTVPPAPQPPVAPAV